MQLLWYEMAKIFWICPCGGVVEREVRESVLLHVQKVVQSVVRMH